MSIKYNNKVIAGKYKEQIIPFANTIDAGIAKIATQEEINEGIDNTSIVTPVYLAQKQDKLIAGDGININEANIISSKITPDKVTIVENENNTISTVARKTVNESIIYDWEGTEAEYHQALMNGEINPDWYCYITDDELSVSYNDVLSRTLINIAPDGEEVIKDLSKESLHDNITNCITEIPQNIKLELTDGALTLKKGSIVTVPNGFESDGTTPKFDYVTVQNDLSFGFLDTQSGEYILTCNYAGTSVGWAQLKHAGSGTSTEATTGHYYRTDLNKIYYQNSTSAAYNAFPLGIVILEAGVPTLKQVFNGIGFIGSTIWVDKDVKLLVGDGRNDDGTLNNLEIKRATLIRVDVANWGNRNDGVLIYTDAFTSRDYTFALNFQNIERFTNPTYNQHYKYDEQNNKWYFKNGADADYKEVRLTFLAKNIELENGIVKSLPSYEAFRAVDYNDYKNDLDTLNSTLSNATNTLDNTKVNKAGDVMTGNLVVAGQSSPSVAVRCDSVERGVAVSTSAGTQKFVFTDKNSEWIGSAGIEKYTDGRNTIKLQVFSADGTSAPAVRVNAYADNRIGCTFPMCTTMPSTTSSARSDLVAVVTQNYRSGNSWYRVWSDGWKEQGGRGTGVATISLLKAFSNTNYTIQITRLAQAENVPFARSIAAGSFVVGWKIINQVVDANGVAFSWYACGY